MIEKARRILRHEEPPLCLCHPCGALVIVMLVPQGCAASRGAEALPWATLLRPLAGLYSGTIVRAIKTPVLRQMYWNDRLDVQIEVRLIAQAAAIVEIELKGTLTRSPTGFCVGSRAKPTSC